MATVRDLMTPAPKTLEVYNRIADAARAMREGNFGSIPVVSKGTLVGIITDRDLVVRGLANGLGPEGDIESIMSTNVVTVPVDQPVEAARDLMTDRLHRRLPVVDAEGTLVGIISLGDLAVEHADADVLTEISVAEPQE